MNPLWLFDTCGFIFGPAIMLAGLAAVIACLWASIRPLAGFARKSVVALALSPLALGLCGALVGLAVCWSARQPISADWLALGKVCLAGAVVSLIPVIWSLLLPRARGGLT